MAYPPIWRINASTNCLSILPQRSYFAVKISAQLVQLALSGHWAMSGLWSLMREQRT